jgi:protein TonB
MPLPDHVILLKRLGDLLPDSRYPVFASEWTDRVMQAVLFSCIVHVVVFFGVGGKPVNPELLAPLNPPLDVVLVNARSATAPLKAEVYAQANLDGGGDVDEDRQLRSPLPASSQNRPASPSPEIDTRIDKLERQARELLSQIKSSYSVPESAPKSNPAPREPTPAPPGDLAERSLEMARLAARIDQEMDEYQKRPRRDNAQFRAKEYAFARYVEDWRAKVERIGNLNYPEAARRNQIYGSLVLTVEINNDGSLDGVHVERSSGSRILDAAAVKIVELAAPFAPFPEAMKKQVDIFGITRTWTFTREQHLTSQ